MVRQLAESKLDYLLEQPGNPELPKRKNARVRSISREGDIAWLAGIVDGEGNMQATVQFKKCGSISRQYFEPKLRITNTDVRMIKKVSEIYFREGVIFFYTINKVSRYKNKQPTWRDQLEISISGKQGISKMLRILLPHLVNKKRYAELMLETLEWVDAQPYRGRMSAGSNYAESVEFKSKIAAMVEERASFVEPSTTIRRAREVLAW